MQSHDVRLASPNAQHGPCGTASKRSNTVAATGLPVQRTRKPSSSRRGRRNLTSCADRLCLPNLCSHMSTYLYRGQGTHRASNQNYNTKLKQKRSPVAV